MCKASLILREKADLAESIIFKHEGEYVFFHPSIDPPVRPSIHPSIHPSHFYSFLYLFRLLFFLKTLFSSFLSLLSFILSLSPLFLSFLHFILFLFFIRLFFVFNIPFFLRSCLSTFFISSYTFVSLFSFIYFHMAMRILCMNQFAIDSVSRSWKRGTVRK